MKNYLRKHKMWWMSLASREKRMILVGGVFVILFFLYRGIAVPFLDEIEKLRAEIKTSKKTLAWMRNADVAIKKMNQQIQHTSSHLSVVALLALLNQQLELMHLQTALTQLRQTALNAVTLHFQRVSFDRVMMFLLRIEKKFPLMITQMSVVADKTPGVVNADFVLELVKSS